MSEFVKKAAFRYIPVPGGQSDPECTHVILTEKEYEKILEQKNRAVRDRESIKREAELAVKRAQDNALRQIQATAEEARRGMEAVERALEAEKAESAYQRCLNANLLRISKERANADRSLKPKKEHTGYMVASSSEKEIRYKDGNRYGKKVVLWETVLQGPYSVDFTEVQARKQMQEDLFRCDENMDSLMQSIGITGNYKGGYAQIIADKEWKDSFHLYNVMLERRLRANFRSGYWEIVFMHTKALGVVPEGMRGR